MVATGQANTSRADTAALRAVLHVLFSVWGLGVREVAGALGDLPLRTVFEWRERPEAAQIDPPLRLRLSRLLALHKALRRACPDAADQRAWLHAVGDSGERPVDRLASGRTDAAPELQALVPPPAI